MPWRAAVFKSFGSYFPQHQEGPGHIVLQRGSCHTLLDVPSPRLGACVLSAETWAVLGCGVRSTSHKLWMSATQ